MPQSNMPAFHALFFALLVTVLSACEAFAPPLAMRSRFRPPSSAFSAFKCEMQSGCDLSRRSVLFKGAAGLVPLVLCGGRASAARNYGSADCRGYDAGCPLPDADAQKLWNTRLGTFSKENDGYDNVRSSIVELVAADRTLGPSLVRLSFHSSGTYDMMSNSGGSAKGTIRFKEELSHDANAGLEKILPVLEPIKRKHPGISYADLYTLAGAVSVEALGGPHITWHPGRVDAQDPKESTPDGRLPDADKGSAVANVKHLRGIFGRMGFSDQEIVALSGAHNLGKCHYEDSGYEGVWSETPWKFDNSYFNILIKPQALGNEEGLDAWTVQKLPNGKVQYTDVNRVYIMLPTDLALLQDPKTAEWVARYAANSPLFFKDFAAAYSKLLALGTATDSTKGLGV